LKKAQRLYSC